MNSRVISFGCIGLLSAVSCIAQAPATTGEVAMKSKKCGFKINSKGDDKAFGKITISFKRGTLLVVGYKGVAPVVTGAGLRLEYNNDKRERMEYHGEGTLTLDGKFRSIEFFGGSLVCNWLGSGICRLYGEFDETGDTGSFTVKGEREKPWGTGGTYFTLPPRVDATVVPRVRPKGSGGG